MKILFKSLISITSINFDPIYTIHTPGFTALAPCPTYYPLSAQKCGVWLQRMQWWRQLKRAMCGWQETRFMHQAGHAQFGNGLWHKCHIYGDFKWWFWGWSKKKKMVIQNHHRWVSSKKWGIPSRHHGFQYEVVQWSNAKYQPQMNSSGLLMRVGLPH